MSLTFITDQKDGEPDILTDVAHLELTVKNEEGECILSLLPERLWTHELLCELEIPKSTSILDAYLGDRWVGSTEV